VAPIEVCRPARRLARMPVALRPQVKLVALSLVASDEARVNGVRSVRARRFSPYPWSGDSVSALTAAVLLVVQARGAISVHALVRVPRSLLAGPFAPWRALKGPHPLHHTLLIAGHPNRDGEAVLARSPPFGTIYK
jgi:hypothetical protein